MKSILPVACAFVLTLVAHESLADATHHKLIAPADMKWSDVPSLPRGAKAAVIEGPLNQAVPFTVRLRFPANYRIPPHWHPAVERVTVLSGTFHMGMGDKPNMQTSMALMAGSVMLLPAKSSHYAWTEGEVEVQLHGTGPWGITYVDAADDPRKN